MFAAARQHVSLAAEWEGSEWFLGGGRYRCPRLAQDCAAMLRTGYLAPDARIPCGEPLPSSCARLAPTCHTQNRPASKRSVISLPSRLQRRHLPGSQAPRLPGQADMLRPAIVLCTTVLCRNPQAPMSWQQGLCPALYAPLRQSLQFPRDHRPKLHGVASTILLIRVGVCWCLEDADRIPDQRSGSNIRIKIKAQPTTAHSAWCGAVSRVAAPCHAAPRTHMWYSRAAPGLWMNPALW